MLTEDDKTLVKRLRWSASGKVGAEQARLERNAADRIEVLSGLFTNATYEAAEMMKEIERLREALGVAKMWSDKDWVGYEIVCKALAGAKE